MVFSYLVAQSPHSEACHQLHPSFHSLKRVVIQLSHKVCVRVWRVEYAHVAKGSRFGCLLLRLGTL